MQVYFNSDYYVRKESRGVPHHQLDTRQGRILYCICESQPQTTKAGS